MQATLNVWLAIFLSQMAASATLIFIGNGGMAAVNLTKTFVNMNKSGTYLFTATCWALAVTMGLIVGREIAHFSEGRINGLTISPTFLISFWMEGLITNPRAIMNGLPTFQPLSEQLPMYIFAHAVGTFIGQGILQLVFWHHIKDSAAWQVRLMHCTAPAYKETWKRNFFVEFIAVIFLIGAIRAVASLSTLRLYPLTAFIPALASGLAISSTTGTAINPFRDIIPRAMMMYLPLKEKADTNWSYAWIPFIAPTLGSFVVGAMMLGFATVGRGIPWPGLPGSPEVMRSQMNSIELVVPLIRWPI